uniref:C3H1-type domain-containing protein n=1 Tax=Chromera velia CCMP2878 TaxID=1169474 RepID=A0A0G4FVH7_9ALVE|eukprot:Cvel_18958.t1-p1 / transcript=Cvel_18958.t1 / gene=Cvel_18958 / organism=Chromera_velia_CCMP2878 / gene_product=hypothetical protein / transcript_product=hypothetical protein / location=Cvel_scaffold1602:29670-34280(-) / protein_length=1047 / sequence_SO=supercontig / SO=protein_coding / is_pseudo=false
MCPYMQKGFCKRGAKCTFAHNPNELRQRPNLAKTRLCEAFMEGSCPKSKEECQFAHGEADLRCTEDVWKTAICQKWLKGECPKQSNPSECRWAHGEDDLRAKPSKQKPLNRRQGESPERTTNEGVSVAGEVAEEEGDKTSCPQEKGKENGSNSHSSNGPLGAQGGRSGSTLDASVSSMTTHTRPLPVDSTPPSHSPHQNRRISMESRESGVAQPQSNERGVERRSSVSLKGKGVKRFQNLDQERPAALPYTEREREAQSPPRTSALTNDPPLLSPPKEPTNHVGNLSQSQLAREYPPLALHQTASEEDGTSLSYKRQWPANLRLQIDVRPTAGETAGEHKRREANTIPPPHSTTHSKRGEEERAARTHQRQQREKEAEGGGCTSPGSPSTKNRGFGSNHPIQQGGDCSPFPPHMSASAATASRRHYACFAGPPSPSPLPSPSKSAPPQKCDNASSPPSEWGREREDDDPTDAPLAASSISGLSREREREHAGFRDGGEVDQGFPNFLDRDRYSQAHQSGSPANTHRSLGPQGPSMSPVSCLPPPAPPQSPCSPLPSHSETWSPSPRHSPAASMLNPPFNSPATTRKGRDPFFFRDASRSPGPSPFSFNATAAARLELFVDATAATGEDERGLEKDKRPGGEETSTQQEANFRLRPPAPPPSPLEGGYPSGNPPALSPFMRSGGLSPSECLSPSQRLGAYFSPSPSPAPSPLDSPTGIKAANPGALVLRLPGSTLGIGRPPPPHAQPHPDNHPLSLNFLPPRQTTEFRRVNDRGDREPGEGGNASMAFRRDARTEETSNELTRKTSTADTELLNLALAAPCTVLEADVEIADGPNSAAAAAARASSSTPSPGGCPQISVSAPEAHSLPVASSAKPESAPRVEDRPTFQDTLLEFDGSGEGLKPSGGGGGGGGGGGARRLGSQGLSVRTHDLAPGSPTGVGPRRCTATATATAGGAFLEPMSASSPLRERLGSDDVVVPKDAPEGFHRLIQHAGEKVYSPFQASPREGGVGKTMSEWEERDKESESEQKAEGSLSSLNGEGAKAVSPRS